MAAANIGTLKTKKDIIHDFPTITAKCLKLRVQVERPALVTDCRPAKAGGSTQVPVVWAWEQLLDEDSQPPR